MTTYQWGKNNLRTEDRNKDIDVWFDVDNLEHLKAYRHLQEQGFWPVGFPPEDIQFPTGWNSSLRARLADAYVELKLLGLA